MTTQSNTQQGNTASHTAWAREKLDEMDATLGSLESDAGKLQGDARVKAESALADMRAHRDHFRQTLEQDGQAGKDAHAHTKAALEAGWSAFQASVHATSTQQATMPDSTPPADSAPAHG
jgi:hypothetical protein